MAAATGYIIGADQYTAQLREAFVAAAGAAGPYGDQTPSIEAALSPMWRSLPKDSHGRIERNMLRYVAHRYFVRSRPF